VLIGEAAVNLEAAGEGMVVGDLVNTASRIQSAADPGAVFVRKPRDDRPGQRHRPYRSLPSHRLAKSQDQALITVAEAFTNAVRRSVGATLG